MSNNRKNIDDFFKRTPQKEEPEKLKKYISDINKGVDPNKQTVIDRVADFFKNLAQKTGIYYSKNREKEIEEKSSTLRRKFRVYYRWIAKKIADRFNFESGVDILDDTSVLYRRNLVNRNILIITNFVFIIFTMIGNQLRNNIIITLVFAVIMIFTSRSLKNIINEEPRTLLKQQMAMYVGSIYILVASIGVYTKLRIQAVAFEVGNLVSSSTIPVNLAEQEIIDRVFYSMTDMSIAQAGYILIYFALVVIALYQDPTLLRILFKGVLVIMTIIHIAVMYPLFNYIETISDFYNFLFVTNPNVLTDIVLRTILLVIFNIALYSSVSIGQMMNEKRKQELIKRRDMERDFKAVVGDVFDVIGVFNSHTIQQNKEDAHRVAELASRLASVLGLSSNVCTEIYDYSVIHVDKGQTLSILEYEDKEVLNERDYIDIREKTILGSVIIKRLQLNQKSEDIVRAHFEKTVDSEFTERIKRVQRSQEGQIILLAEMYDILRQNRNYKNKLQHKRALDLLHLEFKEYFEPYILDRFMKYEREFETYYEKYKFSEGA